jgi:hypothetical protein
MYIRFPQRAFECLSPRASDSVGQGRTWESTFLTHFQVTMCCCCCWFRTHTKTGHPAPSPVPNRQDALQHLREVTAQGCHIIGNIGWDSPMCEDTLDKSAAKSTYRSWLYLGKAYLGQSFSRIASGIISNGESSYRGNWMCSRICSRTWFFFFLMVVHNAPDQSWRSQLRNLHIFPDRQICFFKNENNIQSEFNRDT